MPGTTFSAVRISLRLYQRAGRAGTRGVQRREFADSDLEQLGLRNVLFHFKVTAEFDNVGNT